jgi:hypothetical protein
VTVARGADFKISPSLRLSPWRERANARRTGVGGANPGRLALDLKRAVGLPSTSADDNIGVIPWEHRRRAF